MKIEEVVIKSKLTTNKFYLYAGSIVKLKKISKKQNKLVIEKLDTSDTLVLPYEQSDLILYRIYTVGEVAKIVEKRPDTIRKYEKRNLIPAATKFGEKYKGYSNWRFYTEQDVYIMVEFFNTRVPGRPINKSVDGKVKDIAQKVQFTLKDNYAKQ